MGKHDNKKQDKPTSTVSEATVKSVIRAGVVEKGDTWTMAALRNIQQRKSN